MTNWMLRYRHATVLIAVWLLAGMGSAVAAQEADYASLMKLSTEELMARGREACMADSVRAQEALMAYTIASRRYHEGMNEAELRQCAAAYNNVGYVCFFYFCDYAKAYSNFVKALDINDHLPKPYNINMVCLNLGNMYVTTAAQYQSEQLNRRGMELYKRSFDASVESHAWETMITSFVNLVHLALSENQLDSISGVMATFAEHPIPRGIPMRDYANLLAQAIRACQQGQYGSAIALFERQEATIDTHLTPERYSYLCMNARAALLRRLHRYDEAAHCLNAILRLSEDHDMRDIRVEAFKSLGELYREMGLAELSRQMHYRYLEAKDSLMMLNHLQNVSEMQFLYQLHKVDEQVERLSQQHRTKNFILLLAAIVGVVMAVATYIIYRKNRELYRSNRELYLRNQQLLLVPRPPNLETEPPSLPDTEPSSLPETERSSHPAPRSSLLEDSLAAPRYATSRLGDDAKQQLRQRIIAALADEEVLCNADLTLNQLSDLVESKPKYVSQVINEVFGKTFTALLGEERIKVACRRMNDTARYGHLTIEAIAQGVGMRSRSAFISNFKQFTGLTPSAYQRQARDAHARQ